ncbi:hypothetical protein OPT61_g7606 [Boeremia exigua]|uniref:Uncharacterized protein n=1 Tax=Boeremia exigua TaxID=749465 RepID=A0ACC2I1Z1_9PLEO|nr:hypothetical protein OPT61_g7606 [Boeremia exigua]
MSSGTPTSGAPLTLPVFGPAPEQAENSAPRVPDNNASSATGSQSSPADVLPGSLVSNHGIQLPVLPDPKPDLIQLNDATPVMMAALGVASKHIDISQAALDQLFKDEWAMDRYESWVKTLRTTTEYLTEYLMENIPRVERNLAHAAAKTTQDDTSQFRLPSAPRTVNPVEAMRRRSSNGSESESSGNSTTNSATVDPIATDGHREEESGKRVLDSAAVPSAKKPRTERDGAAE